MTLPPSSVLVAGAGIVGLSVAWFLRERGAEVTVVDRDRPAAGASWGNAGWLSPALAVPLPEPGVLRYGLRALCAPDAPLSVPLNPDPRLWEFLARFARHCTPAAWRHGVRSYLPINGEALSAYEHIAVSAGAASAIRDAPITVCFDSAREAVGLLRELSLIKRSGGHVEADEIPARQVRGEFPQLSARVRHVVRIHRQRYIDPGGFVRALSGQLTARGVRIRTGFSVTAVRRGRDGFIIESPGGEPEHADAVVLATGAWLPALARPFGVRTRTQAGRGYSVTVPTDQPVPSPLYFPSQRVACTPYQGALRIAGIMEFAGPDAPLNPRRLEAMLGSVRTMFHGVRFDQCADRWVGPRPVTADGLPLIGATRAPGVYVAGGHGMWGITLGPATGRLLAEQIVTGVQPATLRAFDPLR